MSRGILKGALWGLAVAAVMVVNLSLLVPLPSDVAPPVERPDRARTPVAQGGPVAQPNTAQAVQAHRPSDAQETAVASAPLDVQGSIVAPDAPSAPADTVAQDARTASAAPSAQAPSAGAVEQGPEVITRVAPVEPSLPGAVDQSRSATMAASPMSAVIVEGQTVKFAPLPTRPVRPSDELRPSALDPAPAPTGPSASVAPSPDPVINPVQAVDLAPVPAGMPPPPAASQDRVRAQAVAAAPDRIVMSVPEEGIETPATLPEEALPLAPEAPEPDPEAPPAITVLPDRADESTPSIGDRVVPLTEREAAIPLTDRDVAAPPAQVSPLPAWMRFASRAETPPGAVLSVVLLDPGVSAQARDAFIALGLPVTVALDTSELDPAPALSAYRASGVEVLLIPGPAGAEATLAAYPEALGLLEGDDGPPRAGALAVDGHGLVLQPDGLNGAVQDMAREGLPALRIFRQIDAQQERPEVIVRYLSRAAFEAAQTGGVVMLGTILPDTLEALEMFRDSPDDRGVILAPVSVQMRRLMSMPGERG